MAGVDGAACFLAADDGSSPVAIAIPTSSLVAQRLDHSPDRRVGRNSILHSYQPIGHSCRLSDRIDAASL
jgi:hypothetical protein